MSIHTYMCSTKGGTQGLTHAGQDVYIPRLN